MAFQSCVLRTYSAAVSRVRRLLQPACDESQWPHWPAYANVPRPIRNTARGPFNCRRVALASPTRGRVGTHFDLTGCLYRQEEAPCACSHAPRDHHTLTDRSHVGKASRGVGCQCFHHVFGRSNERAGDACRLDCGRSHLGHVASVRNVTATMIRRSSNVAPPSRASIRGVALL